MSQTERDEGDLTRKQRREQARNERKAAEEALAAGSARKRRMAQLGGAIAAVVVVIVVVLVVTSGGSSNKPIAPKSKAGKQQAAVVQGIIGGIPQKGNVLGSATAPVTMQYFGDLECPICRDFTLGALPKLIQKWVKTGKMKIEYRSLETATREPETFRTQQVAALAAGKQNKMWDFVELFYHEQGEEDSGYVTEAYIQGLAEQVPGLNLSKWSTDRGDTNLDNQIATDTQEANNNGFNGTPSFLLGRSGGKLERYEYSSLTDPSGFDEAIEKLVKA